MRLDSSCVLLVLAALLNGCSSSPPQSGLPLAPVALTTPLLKLAPEAGLELAKNQPGYAEVGALHNPFSGSPEAVQRGAQHFARNCASCHGAEGQGDGAIALSMTPRPRDLTRSDQYVAGAGELALFRTVKFGLYATGMAPWKGRMSDDEIWEVVCYVRTLQRPVQENSAKPFSRPATP